MTPECPWGLSWRQDPCQEWSWVESSLPHLFFALITSSS